MNIWLLILFIVIAGAIGVLLVRTAYREGVCDGYRYAKSPRDPRLAHLRPILRASYLVPPRPGERLR